MPKSKILFFSDIENNFYALDIRTAEVLWKTKMNTLSRGLHSTIGNQIFVHHEHLTSNNILTGEVNWKKESTSKNKFDSHFVASDGEAIYRKLHYNKAERLDSINGNIQWSIPLFESKGPMGIDMDNVYLIDRNAPNLRVYDKITGEVRWMFDIPYDPSGNYSELGHTPVTNDGKVFIRTTLGRVYALSKTDGGIIWKKRLADYISNYLGNESVPIFNGDNLIVVANYKIYALNKNNGTTVWETNLGDRVYSSPFLYKDHLYLSSNEYLYCLNANSGAIKWKRSLPSFKQVSPIVYDDVIYTGGTGYYFAFNTSDGSEIWRFPIDLYSNTSPTMVIGESEEVIYPTINPSTN